MQVSGIVWKRVFNESTVKYSSRHSCNTAHSKSIWSMVSVWPQWWQAVLGTRYGIWWPLYGLFEVGWLQQTLQLWLGAGISSVALMLVSRDRDLCHIQLRPTWFEPISECRWQGPHICIVDTCQRVYILVEGLFASWSTLSFASMPQWLGIQQKRTRVILSLSNQSRFMIWQIKGLSVSSPLIACKKDIES